MYIQHTAHHTPIWTIWDWYYGSPWFSILIPFLAERWQSIDQSEDQSHVPPAQTVRQAPGERSKQTTGGEAGDIEEGYLRLVVTVGGVQGVDIGPLHPVTEQGQEVGNEKYPLQSETFIYIYTSKVSYQWSELRNQSKVKHNVRLYQI